MIDKYDVFIRFYTEGEDEDYTEEFTSEKQAWDYIRKTVEGRRHRARIWINGVELA